MLKNFNTTQKADLRKKSSLMDKLEYSGYNLQSCMVILLVLFVLLLSVASVVAAPNPNFLIGI